MSFYGLNNIFSPAATKTREGAVDLPRGWRKTYQVVPWPSAVGARISADEGVTFSSVARSCAATCIVIYRESTHAGEK